jgi:glutamate:Na+ symporter, ESS family
MDFSWKIVIDAGVISAALVVAGFLRTRLRFLQRFMVPNALTAGFILLPVYNYLAPLVGHGEHRLGDLAYHLLNLSFIAMTLRKPPERSKERNGAVLGMATGMLSQYAIQALTGLLLAYAFIVFLMPSLNPAFGLFLPLGFALGPGQAYAIGRGWERMGFEGAGTVGLTIAAIGYLWACFVGIILINRGMKKGWIKADAASAFRDKAFLTGFMDRGKDNPVGARLTTDSEAVDSFSFHAAVTGFTYFLSFLFLSGLSWLLGFAGKPGQDLAASFWGINFIFSAIVAIVLRRIIDALGLGRHLDDDTLSRISGFSVDYMVAGSIAAISLVFVGRYWLPIIVLSTVCGIVTTITVPWWSSRMFKDLRFERMIMIYGVTTGTLSTGLALLRVLDPEFRTRVSSDYMLASGLTFVLAIPFILCINLPAQAALRGTMGPFWAMVGVSGAYLAMSLVLFAFLARGKSLRRPFSLWLQD